MAIPKAIRDYLDTCNRKEAWALIGYAKEQHRLKPPVIEPIEYKHDFRVGDQVEYKRHFDGKYLPGFLSLMLLTLKINVNGGGERFIKNIPLPSPPVGSER